MSQELQNKLKNIRKDAAISSLFNEKTIKPFEGKNGYLVRLEKFHMHGLHMLQFMTVEQICIFANLTNYDLRCHLVEYRAALEKKVLSYFRQKWVYRMDNSPAIFNSYWVKSIPMEMADIRKALKRKHSGISDEQLEDIIRAYEAEDGEVKKL